MIPMPTAFHDTQQRDFEAVYTEYYQKLLTFVSNRVGNVETAQDIVQSVFLSCYRNWDKFDMQRGSVGTWLYCIARNKIKNHYRDQKDNISIDALANEGGQEMVDQLSAWHFEMLENRDALARALERLPQRNRDIVILSYFGEYTDQEVAEYMNLSHGNVRAILSRSRKLLAQYLKQDGFMEEE